MFPGLFLNNIDQSVAAWFIVHRTIVGVKVSTAITYLGNWQLVLPFMALIILYLLVKKQKQFIQPFILTVASAEVVTFLGKLWFRRPRPLAAIWQPTDFSFPSGHASIAIAFYGYLAYIIIKSFNQRYQWLLTILAILLMVLIGFSRLYLGVHYLSDVLIGYLVGAAALILGVWWTRKILKAK